MIPILYAKNETAFQNNGVGHLTDIISASVKEERNGAYELTFTYPVTGVHFSEISEGAIVKAKPNETSGSQLFRIYKTSRPIGGIVTYSAEHISYDLRGLPCLGYDATGVTASAAMNSVFTACPIQNGFSAWTDISSLLNMHITEPRSLRNFCGGQKGSVLDVYGGEFEWDNYTVKLHGVRGADRGVILNYGKNLITANQERNIQETYTHFCPYAKYSDGDGEHVVKLTEGVIQLVDPEDIGHSRALTMDLTNEFPSGTTSITEAQLRAKAQQYISDHNIGVPKINLKVSFVQIWDSPEYAEFQGFEHVSLCDTVTVRFSALGINASAKVVKTTFDVLKERYSSIELGTLKNNIADTVAEMQEEQLDTATIRTEIARQVDDATQAITGNSGGYVVHYPARNPSEILIMDTADVSTARKVWRWNNGGLGYSSNGINGPYETAITADGKIVAGFIKTGTLSAIDIMACTISGGTMNINDKFIVDAQGNATIEGTVVATAGEIGGCSIVDGVLEVPAANIDGRLAADQIDADGITAENVNISGAINATEGTFTGTINSDTANIVHASVGDLNAEEIALNGDMTMADGKIVTGKIRGKEAVADIQDISVESYTYNGRRYDSDLGKELVTIRVDYAEGDLPNATWLTNYPVTIEGYYVKLHDPYRVHIKQSFSGIATYAAGGHMTDTITVQMSKFDAHPEIYDSFTVEKFSAPLTIRFTSPSPTGTFLYIDESDLLPSVHSRSVQNGQNIGATSAAFRYMYARNFNNVSARQLKEDILPYDERHERFFDELRPCTFRYIGDYKKHCGMILDEVGTALEKSGLTPGEFSGYVLDDERDPNGLGALSYHEFVSLAIWEIQKLKKRVQELEAKEIQNG